MNKDIHFCLKYSKVSKSYLWWTPGGLHWPEKSLSTSLLWCMGYLNLMSYHTDHNKLHRHYSKHISKHWLYNLFLIYVFWCIMDFIFSIHYSYCYSPEIPSSRNIDEAVIKMIESKVKCPSLTIRDLSTFDLGKRVKVRSCFKFYGSTMCTSLIIWKCT